MTGLYFQPSPNRTNDDSLPTAPDQGVDVSALIDQLINRIEAAERKIEYKVDRNSLAKILLTDRDVVIQGDQVNILGQVNIVDWVRDISGNPTGGIDVTSLTRITGGKVQTGIIESFNWSTTAGSQINLDTGTIVTGGSVSPKFSVSASGVLTCQEAVVTGTLTAGSFIQSSVQLDDEFGVTLSTIASNASSGKNISDALLVSGTSVLKGVLVPTDSGALKTGTITWNATTGALTGGTGIAITEWGIIGAASGSATFSIQASTGAATFKGDISGGSNINISGSAKFDGLTSVSGSSYTMSVNESLGQDNGIYVVAKTGGNAAIEAIGSGSSDGVDGTTATGFGVSGFATGAAGIGVVATNSAGGTALQVVGKMTISSSTLVTNLNADQVDGFHASSLAKLSGGNTFSGDQTFSNNITVTGLVRGGNFRLDQSTVTGSATATFPGTNKPGSTTTCVWIPFTVNGTFGHLAWWPNV